MKVDWMILANAAEVHGGLITMMGGAWDTLSPSGAHQADAPADAPLTRVRGTLVVRLLANRSETDRPHRFELRVLDADGGDVAPPTTGEFVVQLGPDLPVGWEQSFLMAIDLTGMPLRRFGMYEITLTVDGNFLASRPFRVKEPQSG